MRDINKIYQDTIAAANAKQTGALARVAGVYEEATSLYLERVTEITKEHASDVKAAEAAWRNGATKKLVDFDGLPAEPEPEPEPKRLPRTEVDPVDLESLEQSMRTAP